MAKKDPVPTQDFAAADDSPVPGTVETALDVIVEQVTTAEQAAALVGIEPDHVFAFCDHGAFVRVVTVDGRKLDGNK